MNREVYLDNAATTPPRPEVAEVMSRVLVDDYGNASSPHALGKRAKVILEDARAIVAEALDVQPNEIFFTSGGTESNNLAIRGVCRARGKDAGSIITSSLEHPSVTRSIRGLKREGWEVSYVDAQGGEFDLDAFERFLQRKTQLISIMTVQNELGWRLPIEQVSLLRTQLAPEALVHTDIVQAFGKVPLDLHGWGIDLASISAHKIGGPKGVGVLYVKEGTHMFTTAFGGGQERGLRSGTEAVFLIAGLAEAVRLTYDEFEEKHTRACALWNQLVGRLTSEIPHVIINSRADGSPFIVNFAVPHMYNQRALEYLSEQGVYVSKASACSENESTVAPGTWRPKHPLSLQAAGIPLSLGKNTLRISFEYDTTAADIDYFVDALKSYLHVV